MHRLLLTLFIISLVELSIAQTEQKDSARVLETVVVTAFEQQLPLHRSPISVSVLNRNTADFSNKTSMVSGFNTQAGVRMEERSPASYRVNIRGSSLRSPFG